MALDGALSDASLKAEIGLSIATYTPFMDAVNSGGTFIATWVRVGHDVVSSDRVAHISIILLKGRGPRLDIHGFPHNHLRSG